MNPDDIPSYFDKGKASFEKGNYHEALHFFKESQKTSPSSETSEYISKCEEKIKSKETTSTDEASQSNTTNDIKNDNEECERIINNNNYYDILNINKDFTPDDIKKAYKKLAIKFHPDKNNSPLAEEAFKKISTAYQTLSDPKLKEQFDKYGSEEEYREKYYQEHQKQYEDDIELDPFEIFQMFMSGGLDQNTIEKLKRQRRRHQQQNANTPPMPQLSPKVMRIIQIVQMLPLILLFLYYAMPSLLERTEMYSFVQDVEHPFKKVTFYNEINYYVGSAFMEKYNGKKKELKVQEKEIEKKYLEYLQTTCKEKKKKKKEIEYHLKFYKKGSKYNQQYVEELKMLNMESCGLYEEYKDKIKFK